MHISITYSPATLADFLAAVDSMRECGATVAVAAPVASGGARPMAGHAGGGPYEFYCGELGVSKFKRTAEERAACLSMDEAAEKRMEVPGWRKRGLGLMPPADSGGDAIAPDLPDDETL